MPDYKVEKPKITKPEQLIINGEQVEKLGKKAKLSDRGLRMNDAVDRHLRKRATKP